MKKNFTKIMMLALTLCMMIAMFAVVASAETADKDFTVTLDKYYAFYNGMEHEAPKVTVYDGDEVVASEAYEVEWKYAYKADDELKEFDYFRDYFREAGAYYVTVKGAEGTAYESCTVEAFFCILSTRGNQKYAFENKTLDSVYGDTIDYTLEGGYSSAAHNEIKLFRAVNEDGTFGEYTTEAPTKVGKYQYYVIDYGYYYYLDITIDFKIVEKKATILVHDISGIEYGDKIEFAYVPGEGFLDKDADKVKDIDVEYDWVEGFGDGSVGSHYFTAEATLENYDIDVVYDGVDYDDCATVTISQKKVIFKDNYVLQYNGKIQLPEVEIANLVGDDKCSVEVIGSSRKYGGTYTIRVVALGNDNYTLGDGVTEVKLTYTIVADGKDDSNTAVKDFIEGVVDAGETVGKVVETVSPVVNTIGKFIIGGIKSGVSALVNDFFGRVFG